VAGFLRIEVFDQLHGAFDVGEESGDGLALTRGGAPCLNGSLLGEDALSEMLRRVANGSRV